MALDDNERRILYRNLINDPATQSETRKYSFNDWERKLLSDEKAIGKLAQFSVGRNWAIDENDFTERFVPELKAPPTPKPKPVPTPAQQFPLGIATPESIKGAAPSVTDIGREMAFKPAVQQPIEPVEPVEPIGVMAPEPIVEPAPSVTEVAREMAFKPPVQPKMPKEEEERGFGEWAGDLTGTILEGGKRITKNLLGAVGYFAQTQAATDPMFSLPYEKRQQMMQGAGQTMYNVAEKAQKDFQAEVAKRNIQTDVLQAIENKQYNKVPEAALYTVGDAAMQIIPAVFTMGGSSFMQTLPTAYKDGVESIAKEKGISPEQVIASGDDAIITATITSGIVGALDKYGADRIGGFISTKAGYKAVRDWLLKQNINKTLAKGAQLLGAGIGESGTEYLQEGVGQAGIIAAKSPTMAAFFEKLPDELFTAQAERQRRGAAVGGLIGGTGVAGAGRALTSALSSQKAPGLDKFSNNVVNNEIIQEAARGYGDNITKSEQQGRKPDSFNQKQLKKISENPEAWVRDEIKYIQQTIESNKTLGLDSKVEENSLAKATSLLNQIKAEKKSMEQAAIAPAQEAVLVAPEAEVVSPEGGAPMPQKVKILGKDVNMYNDYIPSRPEDVEPDAMYIFNADSRDGIPPLLQDVAYANKRESNGVKTENWHASISGEDLLNLYPQTAASPNLIAAPEAAPVAEDIPFEEVPAETEDELAFLDEMRLTPEEDAARLAQEGIIPAAPVAPAEEVIPEVVAAAPAPKAEPAKTNEEQIAILRAEEQAELDSRIKNADKYRGEDGKVDKTKLTKKADIKAFNEVYDKYDKLISPLMTEQPAAPKKEEAIKPEPKKEEARIEQTKTRAKDSKDAQSHSSDLSGEAYELEDGTGLVQGFNLMGKPVYSGYKKGKRTRVDIDSYTGDVFTAEELSALKELKKELEASEKAAQTQDPFKQQGRVAKTDSVPDNVSKLVEDITKSLGIDKKIIIITDGDFNEGQYQKHGLYGTLAQVRSAKQSASNPYEYGAKRYMSDADAFYIYYDGKLKGDQLFTVVSHEIGHIVEQEVFNNSSEQTKKAVKEDYEKWLASLTGKTVEEVAKETRDITLADLIEGNTRKFDASKDRYISSFSEYFADNVSKWARTSAKPKSAVDKYFSGIVEAFKKLHDYVFEKGLYSKSLFDWLDGMYEAEPTTTPEFTSKQESSASQEFDGLKKPSKIKTKSFDGKHGKGAFERMKNITDNFEDIMDGMSGKIKQDCL